MKTHSAIIASLAVATSLVADTLQIGAFTLPYRFEDTNITDIVRYVATNDVQSFCASITGFQPPYQDKNGNICVQRINTPGTSFYRPEVFIQGIKFYIENGQTNCVIKQSLTDAAKAIESELPMRTNLVAHASSFVDKVFSGFITNCPSDEIRSSICYVRAGELRHPTTEEANDDVLMGFVASMPEGWTPLPLCHLHFLRATTGLSTNTIPCLPLRGYDPSRPISSTSIYTVPLVLLNGLWSVCVDGEPTLTEEE